MKIKRYLTIIAVLFATFVKAQVLSGRVTEGFDGEDIEGVSVLIYIDNLCHDGTFDHDYELYASIITDSNGQFLTVLVPNTKYKICVKKGDITLVGPIMYISKGRNTYEHLQLPHMPSGHRTYYCGVVTGDDGQYLSGVEIVYENCLDNNYRLKYLAETSESGGYCLSLHETDKYRVTAYKTGYTFNPVWVNETRNKNSPYYLDLTMTKNSSSNLYSSSGSESGIGNAFIIGAGILFGGLAIYDALSDNSSSSSSNGSTNNQGSTNSENVMEKGNVIITRADLYDHNVLTGKFDHIIMYMRNNNEYDVFVNVEMKVNGEWKKCRITYENGAYTETLNGSYTDDRSSDIHLKGKSTRVVEVTSNSLKRPDAVRITKVF